MAGKSSALHGYGHDATAFQFIDVGSLFWPIHPRIFLISTSLQADTLPVEYFGEQLVKAGYNYYGTERMYSGTTGQEFHVSLNAITSFYL